MTVRKNNHANLTHSIHDLSKHHDAVVTRPMAAFPARPDQWMNDTQSQVFFLKNLITCVLKTEIKNQPLVIKNYCIFKAYDSVPDFSRIVMTGRLMAKFNVRSC